METEYYKEEVQPYWKTDYKPIIINNNNLIIMAKEFENMSKMNSMMAIEGCEMEEDHWQEYRRWMADDVKASSDGGKENMVNYRKMRRIWCK